MAAERNVSLTTLLERLPAARVSGDRERSITSIEMDSRCVRRGAALRRGARQPHGRTPLPRRCGRQRSVRRGSGRRPSAELAGRSDCRLRRGYPPRALGALGRILRRSFARARRHRRHRHERKDDDDSDGRRHSRGRRDSVRSGRDRRGRIAIAALGAGEHDAAAAGASPIAGPDARRRRESRRDGGELARARPRSRRRRAFLDRGTDERDARPPRFPSDSRGVRRGEAAALHARGLVRSQRRRLVRRALGARAERRGAHGDLIRDPRRSDARSHRHSGRTRRNPLYRRRPALRAAPSRDDSTLGTRWRRSESRAR